MLSQLALNLDLHAAEIQRRRRAVAVRLLKESTALRDVNFGTIQTRDLFELFCHYDELFFEGHLSSWFEHDRYALKFRLSRRMTSTGGMTTYRRSPLDSRASTQDTRQRTSHDFEIAISSTLLFNTHFDGRPVKVGGVPTANRLDALQRIFEHELVHLLEMLIWEDSSCARQRFKGIVRRLFGHLESNHQLLTPAETARTDWGISIGDRVQFLYRGNRMTGIVHGIQRRATVMVADPACPGHAPNQRFYVPLERLQKVVR